MSDELTRERRAKEAAIAQARSWMRYARRLVRQRDDARAQLVAVETAAPRRLAVRNRNKAHVYEIMRETETHVELRWKTLVALPRETFEQDYTVVE